jgi:hypothetical protein
VSFEAEIDRNYIEHAEVRVTLPVNTHPEKDIRFRRQQSGGISLDLTYAMSMLCSIFGTDPGTSNPSCLFPLPAVSGVSLLPKLQLGSRIPLDTTQLGNIATDIVGQTPATK